MSILSFLRRTKNEETEIASSIPASSRITLDNPKEIVQQALDIQNKREMSTIASRTEMLRIFLHENNIQIYSNVDVIAYMNKMYGKEYWDWFVVKKSDIRDHTIGYGRVYEEPIPVPVLMQMDSIYTEFKDAFFEIAAPSASRSENIGGDPFLSVRLSQSQERIIIERWNEPSFRMTK